MINNLAKDLNHFPGAANCTRCLAHIVNLAARAILRQFDVSKGHDEEASEDEIRAEEEVQSTKDSDDDDEDGTGTVEELSEVDQGEEDELDDNDEKGMNLAEVEQVTREKVKDMAKVTEPLHHTLYKVSLLTNSNTLTHPFSAYQLRNFANAVKNSPTILLPEWRKTIKQLATDADDPKKALADRIMPRDVAMRWNSTYDMLKFAKSYQDPINQMTDSRSLKLRYCMITELEWELIKQLQDVLKVRVLTSLMLRFQVGPLYEVYDRS
jgi:hypothetical protein